MRTITGLYDDYEDAVDAVDDLEELGVPQTEISIVASNSTGWYEADENDEDIEPDDKTANAADSAAGGAGLGAMVGGAGGLLTGLGLMAIPGVGPVVAAGWLAATAVGALGGAMIGGAAGGLVGALTKSGIPEEDAHTYAEGVRRGGTLVTARVEDDLVAEAQEILDNANAVDLPERRASYKQGGWSGFDENADQYSADEIAEERTKPSYNR